MCLRPKLWLLDEGEPREQRVWYCNSTPGARLCFQAACFKALQNTADAETAGLAKSGGFKEKRGRGRTEPILFWGGVWWERAGPGLGTAGRGESPPSHLEQPPKKKQKKIKKMGSHPRTGSTAMARGLTSSVSKSTRLSEPSSRARSILSRPLSVQNMALRRWSTASPSGLRSPAGGDVWLLAPHGAGGCRTPKQDGPRATAGTPRWL